MNITTPLRVLLTGCIGALVVAGAWAFVNLVGGGGDLNGFQKFTVLGGLVLGLMLGEVLRRRHLIDVRERDARTVPPEDATPARAVPMIKEPQTLPQVLVLAVLGTVACVGVTAVLRMIGLFSPITWQNWIMVFVLIGGITVLNWMGRRRREQLAREREDRQ